MSNWAAASSRDSGCPSRRPAMSSNARTPSLLCSLSSKVLPAACMSNATDARGSSSFSANRVSHGWLSCSRVVTMKRTLGTCSIRLGRHVVSAGLASSALSNRMRHDFLLFRCRATSWSGFRSSKLSSSLAPSAWYKSLSERMAERSILQTPPGNWLLCWFKFP